MKQLYLTALTFIFLLGCNTTRLDSPYFYNGYWYMTSGDNCVKFRQMSEGKIMCFNDKDQITGYRTALTPEQLRMYQLKLAYEIEQTRQANLQAQQLNQTLNNMSQSLNQNTQNFLQNFWQNSQQFTPTIPTFVNPYKKKRINCLHTGMLTNCSY